MRIMQPSECYIEIDSINVPVVNRMCVHTSMCVCVHVCVCVCTRECVFKAQNKEKITLAILTDSHRPLLSLTMCTMSNFEDIRPS